MKAVCKAYLGKTYPKGEYLHFRYLKLPGMLGDKTKLINICSGTFPGLVLVIGRCLTLDNVHCNAPL